MVALVHQLKQQTDHGILDAIQKVHCNFLFVEYRGRWILGTRSASKCEVREAAITAFKRARLPVEIRHDDGTVVFGLRAGYQDFVDDLAREFGRTTELDENNPLDALAYRVGFFYATIVFASS